jgi:CO/xanthine dehydrogenase FAD-binding subunit
MYTFAYHHPKSVEEAIEISASYEHQVRYLAGGTDLLVRIKQVQFQPKAVIDLKSIQSLSDEIEVSASEIRIGALAILSSIEHNKAIAKHFPALIEAASSIGSVQIRNRATLGGNICNASPAADSFPPLFIYGARIKIVGKAVDRIVPIEEFVLGPGRTCLSNVEFVHSIILPIPDYKQAASFDRLTRRRGVDLATINLACQVCESGVTRFAVGAAAPVPFVVEERDGLLVDAKLGQSEKTELIRGLMQAASPITDVRASKEYRKEMLVVQARRTLEKTIQKIENKDR